MNKEDIKINHYYLITLHGVDTYVKVIERLQLGQNKPDKYTYFLQVGTPQSIIHCGRKDCPKQSICQNNALFVCRDKNSFIKEVAILLGIKYVHA